MKFMVDPRYWVLLGALFPTVLQQVKLTAVQRLTSWAWGFVAAVGLGQLAQAFQSTSMTQGLTRGAALVSGSVRKGKLDY